MSPRPSRRGLIDPGWPRAARSRRLAGPVDPLAPPPRREAPRPRPRRSLRPSSAVGAATGAGSSVWLGLLAFVGAGGLVLLAAELTLRVLGP